MRIFAKCLETVGVFMPIQKIKKFDFMAKTFGCRWDSNLHVNSQKPRTLPLSHGDKLFGKTFIRYILSILNQK